MRVVCSVTALPRYLHTANRCGTTIFVVTENKIGALPSVTMTQKKEGKVMQYRLGFDAGYYLYHAIRRKADRAGLSVSQILRMALSEYLERNPKENEQEERKKYYFPEDSDSEHQA